MMANSNDSGCEGIYSDSDSSSQSEVECWAISATVIEDQLIKSIRKNGEDFLSFSQLRSSILRHVDQSLIEGACILLQIEFSISTLSAMKLLADAGAIASDETNNNHLVKRIDAERLCNLLIQTGTPEWCSDHSYYVCVFHEYFGGCEGFYSPEADVAPRSRCIQCKQCSSFFSPARFLCHTHFQTDMKEELDFDPLYWDNSIRVKSTANSNLSHYSLRELRKMKDKVFESADRRANLLDNSQQNVLSSFLKRPSMFQQRPAESPLNHLGNLINTPTPVLKSPCIRPIPVDDLSRFGAVPTNLPNVATAVISPYSPNVLISPSPMLPNTYPNSLPQSPAYVFPNSYIVPPNSPFILQNPHDPSAAFRAQTAAILGAYQMQTFALPSAYPAIQPQTVAVPSTYPAFQAPTATTPVSFPAIQETATNISEETNRRLSIQNARYVPRVKHPQPNIAMCASPLLQRSNSFHKFEKGLYSSPVSGELRDQILLQTPTNVISSSSSESNLGKLSRTTSYLNQESDLRKSSFQVSERMSAFRDVRPIDTAAHSFANNMPVSVKRSFEDSSALLKNESNLLQNKSTDNENHSSHKRAKKIFSEGQNESLVLQGLLKDETLEEWNEKKSENIADTKSLLDDVTYSSSNENVLHTENSREKSEVLTTKMGPEDSEFKIENLQYSAPVMNSPINNSKQEFVIEHTLDVHVYPVF